MLVTADQPTKAIHIILNEEKDENNLNKPVCSCSYRSSYEFVNLVSNHLTPGTNYANNHFYKDKVSIKII